MKRTEMPGFIKPQLATLKSKAPKGEQWIHEIKYTATASRFMSTPAGRRSTPATGSIGPNAFPSSPAPSISRQAIIDGEAAVVHEGRTNFSELQAELAAGKQDRLVYYACDLLWRDGDLRKLPQLERKQMLADLLGDEDVDLPVIYRKHLTGDGQEMFKHAAKLGWEGIISKNATTPYRSERTEAWQKIKTVIEGKFPVIGFVKDPTGVAALYLGKKEGKDLVYMGKVGTGWSRTSSSQIRKQLDTVVSPKSKLTKHVKKPRATWVDRVFMADVEYRDITSEGLLRQSSFKGLSKKER
ncbi:ATP-dependent DNA ligase [Bradyrhizobium sp. JYMT SZCCT0428]|uniref:ATP dependent DNA ligase n=1 Tax=Bradyrhizobium sp. JYMT SZCCT0428 TaxID=2807673 RepID=UPI00201232C6|nr:ATP-dependent DNA ligase [Bradyrhizobium sp. JYMT SZCCT0428]